ncbi:MAG: bifunctional 3,4-dihydroxy-2-butanone-4-phosphate synthase/GTP cyclohydrolase II [Desulfobacterales bacterium]|jgi:3,4-dihydroxy 2-butanone 4-phosphate synthase / GTP cyclohydrolase II|nr:bifunctional 3,4-dihydroxy-2-butanone-4-phosphate synthase/GTP cyclohydrolase II [Desulfobacteraceae bacterium]MBT7086848.1 bifunctional 3,4-dihydroxy-2-butanone-4-phosphate synthase/GTP cyclohydrolase II [Desulfobacterales bacterium]MBT7695960.1 bifunctional 3,4-dihydroxy-2-butanone-4-phosphate synthase/GTP cyclohydrolase II [Desulfobacterales bacterium]
MGLITIEEAIKDIKEGRMVILVDDEDRENEGDLTMAAEHITPEAVNFMATHGRGLICLSLTPEKVDSLDLPMMVTKNTSQFETGFTVSIEARKGVTTGISAADRATTIITAVADDAKPGDLARPGHIFPLRARRGGVMSRVGQTEGSVDLARLAGLKPFGVICEIMDDDGTMARMPSLEKFSEEHGIGICTIADLVKYITQKESFISRAAETMIPTIHGEFKMVAYENEVDDLLNIAMVKGEIDSEKPVLVRVHSECMTGDIFGSLRCDCGEQLHKAMDMMNIEGSGVILYMRQEGRGIGLVNKLKAYELQQNFGFDTVEANKALGFKDDMRDYGIGAQMLVDLGVRKMKLITNNPKKMIGLEGYGLSVVEQVSIEMEPNEHNACYLECKKLKMGHLLNIEPESEQK